MRKNFLLFLAIVALGMPNIFPQIVDTTIKDWDDFFYWDSKPLTELPEHIQIRENEIYLYADYSSITDESIPVYIINNTEESFIYDGYLMSLLQQEFKDSTNSWLRSRSLYYGWCGTGYMMEAGIKPNEFAIFWRSLSATGEEHEVRYNFYTTNISASNPGFGKINMEEVEAAKYDDIALKIGGAEFLVKIIYGEISPFENEKENETLIRRAIVNLASYYPEEAMPVLQQFAVDSSSKYQRQAIANLERIENRKQKK